MSNIIFPSHSTPHGNHETIDAHRFRGISRIRAIPPVMRSCTFDPVTQVFELDLVGPRQAVALFVELVD